MTAKDATALQARALTFDLPKNHVVKLLGQLSAYAARPPFCCALAFRLRVCRKGRLVLGFSDFCRRCAGYIYDGSGAPKGRLVCRWGHCLVRRRLAAPAVACPRRRSTGPAACAGRRAVELQRIMAAPVPRANEH